MDLVRRRIPQSVHEIAVVEADLQLPAVALDGTDILGLAVAGAGGEIDLVHIKEAADGAFQLLADDHGHAIQAFQQRLRLHLHADGVVLGDGVAVIQEFTLQTAADELGILHLEHQMALALHHRQQRIGIGTDLLHLVESRSRRHEAERAAVDTLQRLAAQRQTEAVHRHHGQPCVADLKQGAGMDGTGLVGGHRKAGLVDHGLHGPLLDGHGELVVHGGHLRIVVGGQTGQLEAGVAADHLDHIFLIGGENHDIIGKTADHLAEQTGIQDDASLLMDLGGDGGADTGLHIVARQRQLGVALQQHTLQRGDGAFGSHGAGYGTDGLLQQRFFAGKFQHLVFNPFCNLQAYFSESKHKLIFF